MPISTITEDERVRRYVCAGGETTFPVPFPFFSATDLVVLRVRGADVTTLTLSVDYTVSGAGEQAGGSVTLTSGAQAGDVIVVVSAQPVERTSAWVDGAALTARALNAEFARWWIALQQLRGALRRALTLPVTDPQASSELPAAPQRANKVLGFDADGLPIVTTPNSIGGVLPSAFGANLIQAQNAAAARSLLSAAAVADLVDVNTLVLRDGSQPMTGALRVATGIQGGLRRPDEADTRIVSTDAGVWRIDCQGQTVLSCDATGVTISPAVSDAQAVQLGQVRLQGLPWVTLSGAAVDFVNIPSAAREVVVLLAGVNLSNDSEHILIQIGTGSTPHTSDYKAVGHVEIGSAYAVTVSTAGQPLFRNQNARLHTAEMRWLRVPGNNMWIASYKGFTGQTEPTGGLIHLAAGAGFVTLPQGNVNMVRLRGSGSSETFSAGQAAVVWRL